MGLHYVPFAALDLAMYTRPAPILQRSVCSCIHCAGFKVWQHAWLGNTCFYRFLSFKFVWRFTLQIPNCLSIRTGWEDGMKVLAGRRFAGLVFPDLLQDIDPCCWVGTNEQWEIVLLSWTCTAKAFPWSWQLCAASPAASWQAHPSWGLIW